MKLQLLLLLLLGFSLSSFAQDTIIKRNSELIIAKIIEISDTEIKYKKFNFMDGPTYIELKTKVQKIHYANGMKETFEEVKTEKPLVQVPEDTDYYSKPSLANGSIGKIEPFKSKYKTEGKIINEKRMRQLLLETKDPKIMTLVDQSKRAQRRQFIWIAAMPLAQIALISLSSAPAHSSQVPGSTPGTTTTQYYPRNNGLFALGAVILVGAVACPIIAVNQKKKKKSTTAAAIKLYNQKF